MSYLLLNNSPINVNTCPITLKEASLYTDSSLKEHSNRTDFSSALSRPFRPVKMKLHSFWSWQKASLETNFSNWHLLSYVYVNGEVMLYLGWNEHQGKKVVNYLK